MSECPRVCVSVIVCAPWRKKKQLEFSKGQFFVSGDFVNTSLVFSGLCFGSVCVWCVCVWLDVLLRGVCRYSSFCGGVFSQEVSCLRVCVCVCVLCCVWRVCVSLRACMYGCVSSPGHVFIAASR